jgi:hypothetical protein
MQALAMEVEEIAFDVDVVAVAVAAHLQQQCLLSSLERYSFTKQQRLPIQKN